MPTTFGSYTVDGNLSDWSGHRIDTANPVTGYEVRGDVGGDSFVIAISAPSAIGLNTTLWLNTDQNATTGYQIFGFAGGAEYAVEFGVNGAPSLYSLNAADGARTLIGALTAEYNSANTVVELAINKASIGAPIELNILADINDSQFLPAVYTSPSMEIFDTAQLPERTDFTKKVAIVYSETSAAKYFSTTAYSQLFMTAQSQAAAAGVSYDVITESDLKDISKLVNYDAIIFPSFANVKAADVTAITNALELASEQYQIGLIAAGNFMTNDETGAALAGNAYSRMQQLLGVTLEQFGTGNVTLKAGDVVSTSMMDGYTAGETIRTYQGASWLDFRAVGAGVTTVVQEINGQTYDGAIATQTGGRNVHFATEGVEGDSNLLQHAIQHVVYGEGVRVGLQMSRFTELVASRTDMDQSSFRDDVTPLDANDQPTNNGIYDQMIPILEQWKQLYNFVGSYYVNIGDPTITDGSVDQSTNWAKSLPYYQAILALGNEIGSHSTTHLLQLPAPAMENTNFLVDGTGPGTFDYEFRLSRDLLNQFISTVVPGYNDVGVAVPGATETLETALKIIQYYEYMSGGYSGIGAGYPGGFGYLTPATADKVYLAPNIKFDFTLVGFMGLTAAQAEAEWALEVANITAHGDTPILVWPWHDYGLTNWVTPGDPAPANGYTSAMFTNFIAAAHNRGAEFVTLADLADRIESFEKSGVTYTQTGNTIVATVSSPDAGKFALDLDGLSGGQVIQSVTGWYAYDSDSVFLPQQGGTFEINLGISQTDVTHITSLPMRSELLALSGDGTNLYFTVFGEGNVVIDLRLAGTLNVSGATIVSQVGDILTLNVGAYGNHNVGITFDNVAPVITSNGGGDTASVSVAENIAIATTVIASDNVGETLTFALAGGADFEKFTIDAQTGVLSFVMAPNFEAPTDSGANNVYDILVSVTDGHGGFDFQTLAITVTNAGGLILVGDGNPNALLGSPEGDSLTGLGGNDTLTGGEDNDTMIGGLGDDTYQVRNAGDVVTELANEGYDRVNSILPNYTLAAHVERLDLANSAAAINGTGNDLDNLIIGNGSANVISGAGGADTLQGAGGDDTLNGGDGNDHLNGGTGVDTLRGNGGDDKYFVNDGSDLVVENASEGVDEVVSTITYTLSDNVENLVLMGAAVDGKGNDLANVITGNGIANQLEGGQGNDTLVGLAGVDTLIGGEGNDTLEGGASLDVMIGGVGDDLYVVTATGDQVVESSGEGYDRVFTTANYTLSVEVERLDLAMTAGAINGGGNELANLIVGNAANNILTGAGGADTLLAGEGSDTLVGGQGADHLNGGVGADSMMGGAGDDRYFVDSVDDEIVENSGEGSDVVESSVTYTLAASVEQLTLGGTSAIDGFGNAGDNFLIGNGAANLLSGGIGADTLHGGAGADTLQGGAGNDVLTGGAGADRFLFDLAPAAGGVDTITDFSANFDKMALSAAAFGFAGAGSLAASAFHVGAAAADTADRIVYDNTTGKLWYDADGSSAGAAVHFATLQAGLAVTAADLILV